ncbi:hypothetical protein Cni_G24089 [Canna indica]|uniref:Mal d 1-associated protein n=1 Tax=Canna indica TaxID=4628 RepID=A0AAQ3KYE8_9LILI|nr:hypothetical protein Cni_G24089 [Canna indica]
MGWKWVEDEEPSGRGFGDLVSPNLNPNLDRHVEDDGRLPTRRVVRSTCHTEEVEPGRFVRKCDKTEQILRDCVGRPAEVVESKTEHTEDDVTDEVTKGLASFDSPLVEPFNFPGLRRDIEGIERSLFSGIGDFLEAAEEMTHEFFKSFDHPSWHRRESARSSNEQLKKDTSKQPRESDYSEYSEQMADV